MVVHFLNAARRDADRRGPGFGRNKLNGSIARRITAGRATADPGPYGGGVGSGDRSGWTGIGRDRAAEQSGAGFPPAYQRSGRENRLGKGRAWRQAGRRHACAKTTGKTSGAVMIVMRGSGAAVPAMLVSARFSSSDRRGEADRAAANEGKRAEDQEKTSRYWPHD